MYLSHQTTSPTPVQSAILVRTPQSGPHAKGARTYVKRAYLHFFTGEYDRAEGDLRTAMRFHCADRNVKEEVVSLARCSVSSCVWMLKRLRNQYGTAIVMSLPLLLEVAAGELQTP